MGVGLLLHQSTPVFLKINLDVQKKSKTTYLKNQYAQPILKFFDKKVDPSTAQSGNFKCAP